MSRVFAWIMSVIALGMLALQVVVAKGIRGPVVAFWLLVLIGCAYYLFARKRP